MGLGSPLCWPGLPAPAPVGTSRGGVIEVCSPGQHCRDVAAQLAVAEARTGRVLWMAVGPQATGFGSSALREVPNLTLQQWAIDSGADSRAALQELLRLVRQQAYTVVVLDSIAGLAPPPDGSAARSAARLTTVPTQTQAAAAAAAAAAATAAAAADVGAGRGGPGAASAEAAMYLLGRLETAAAAQAAAAAVAGQRRLGAPGLGGHPQAAPRDSLAPTPTNYKFLHHMLPVLLEEEVLAPLAASCGPEFRTTTLLLNPYTCREGDLIAWGGAAGSVSSRSRCARRAIQRHAGATLHLVPELAGPPAAAGAAAAGEHAHTRRLRAMLSRGGSSGEDGEVLRTWSLVTPVRLVPPPPPCGT